MFLFSKIWQASITLTRIRSQAIFNLLSNLTEIHSLAVTMYFIILSFKRLPEHGVFSHLQLT